MQTGLLAIVAATLLIRPILKHDTPQDGMLFISGELKCLVLYPPALSASLYEGVLNTCCT